MPKPVVLPPPKWALNPNTRVKTGVLLHILVSFSQISALGSIAFSV